MPKVSVILTSFNHGKYIHEAIDSVLKQTFKDFELIIWDDGSSDQSWHLINQYTDSRIKSFRNETNKGPVFGVNKAISEIATGEYIAIHHSDDAWETDKLAKQVAFLDANQDIGAVFSDVQVINQDGTPLINQEHHYYNIFNQANRSRYAWLQHFFLEGNALCHPSVLIRKQCYSDCGGYSDILAQLPDFDMWVRLCNQYDIHVIQEKLVRFRVLDDEMNSSGNRPITSIRNLNEYYRLLRQYKSLLTHDNIFKVFPEFIAYNRGEETDVGYVLARVYLDTADYFLRQLLAIELLFDIFQDSKRREIVERSYGFSASDFVALTGQCDLFSRQELFNKIVERNQQINGLKQHIQRINNSPTWRILSSLHRVFNRVFLFGVVVGRRLVKLIWWTITLQLFTKLRNWYTASGDRVVVPVPQPKDDYCFAIPFDYQIENPPVVKPSIAVVCHLYYPDLLWEFKHYLLNIPFAFDLFITTDSEQKKEFIINSLSKWDKGTVEVRLAPNRGRDIAPKLVTCRDIYERYEFFLHIHSKKSLHHSSLAGWRFYLLETLLGSEKIVSSIFEAFNCDPKLGMVAPEHLEAEVLRDFTGWGHNFEATQSLATRLGLTLSLNGKIDFPSGSMFWGRSAAIKPLLDLNLATEDFPPENKQLDATLAHVIERLFFFICERSGYRWIKIARPVLLPNAERILWIENKTSLINSIKCTQLDLLHSGQEMSAECSEQ